VALLPFIDEERLLNAVQPLYEKLTEEEVLRNSKGQEEVVVSIRNPVFEDLCKVYGKKSVEPLPLRRRNGSYFEGSVQPHQDICLPGSSVSSPLFHLGQEHIEDNHTIS
jgi:5'-3' exoribonuclease 2